MKLSALERLGHAGVLGLGLFLFCLAFYLGNVVPAREELASLQRQKAALAADAEARGGAASGTARDGRGGRLPGMAEAPELLKQLDAVAGKNGISVASASYQLKERGGQLRLEVSLPLQSSYPSLRAYLRDTQALAAPAAIADITLRRAQAGDAALDTQLRLAFSFARTP